MEEEHLGVESPQGDRSRNPRDLSSDETTEAPRFFVGERDGMNNNNSSPVTHPARSRRRSLSFLWGSNKSSKPQQRSGDVLAANFPRQTGGAPLGCAVLSASAAVRSGKDSPSPPLLNNFPFPNNPAFGGPLNAACITSYGDTSGFRMHAEPRFIPSPENRHQPRLGSPSEGGPPPFTGTTPRGAHNDQFDSFRCFRGGAAMSREEEESVEGWGAKGWSGDSVGVKKTSFDAANSKLSASLLGYFPDEFLKHFVTQPTRMQPLINRGYYSRVEAIRRLIVSFLEDAETLFEEKRKKRQLSPTVSKPAETPEKEETDEMTSNNQSLNNNSNSFDDENTIVAQIVNVGAGADTTAFFLARWGGAIVFDVDFPDVCREKAEVIQKTHELRECLGEPLQGPAVDDPCLIRTSNYRLVAADIRNIETLKIAMQTAGLKENLPTLFLCECVLIYLRVEEADAVVRWASQAVSQSPSCLLIYEQFNPNDPFGKMMARNLQIRNCPLLTFTKYPTLESQRIRFAELGWPQCSLADMRFVYEKFLPKSERDRVQVLEIFDELEEWHLIQSHYFLGVLVRPAPPTAGSSTLPSLVGALDIK